MGLGLYSLSVSQKIYQLSNKISKVLTHVSTLTKKTKLKKYIYKKKKEKKGETNEKRDLPPYLDSSPIASFVVNSLPPPLPLLLCIPSHFPYLCHGDPREGFETFTHACLHGAECCQQFFILPPQFFVAFQTTDGKQAAYVTVDLHTRATCTGEKNKSDQSLSWELLLLSPL